jgi:hypothetical protein
MGAFADAVGVGIVDEYRFINPRQSIRQQVVYHPIRERGGMNFTQFWRGNHKSESAGGAPGEPGKGVAAGNQMIEQPGFVPLGVAGSALALAAGTIRPPQSKKTERSHITAFRDRVAYRG